MAGHKWTKEQRAKLSASMKATINAKRNRVNRAVKKATRVSVIPQNHVADAESKLTKAQTPSVDINYIRAQSFRQGLVTALECILRELR